MNVDFGAHPLFSWYVVLLLVSGIVLLLLAVPRSLDRWWRLADAACGSLCADQETGDRPRRTFGAINQPAD